MEVIKDLITKMQKKKTNKESLQGFLDDLNVSSYTWVISYLNYLKIRLENFQSRSF